MCCGGGIFPQLKNIRAFYAKMCCTDPHRYWPMGPYTWICPHAHFVTVCARLSQVKWLQFCIFKVLAKWISSASSMTPNDMTSFFKHRPFHISLLKHHFCRNKHCCLYMLIFSPDARKRRCTFRSYRACGPHDGRDSFHIWKTPHPSILYTERFSTIVRQFFSTSSD